MKTLEKLLKKTNWVWSSIVFFLLLFISGCFMSQPPSEVLDLAKSEQADCLQRDECTEYKLVDSYNVKNLSESTKLNGIDDIWCLAFKYSFYNYYGRDERSWWDSGYIYLIGHTKDGWITLIGTHMISPKSNEPINCNAHR